MSTVSCIVIYCCITNNPKMQWLKTTNMYYVTISVGRESGHILTGSSGSGSLTGYSQGFGCSYSHPQAGCRGIHFQVHSCGSWKASGPHELLSEDINSSPDVPLLWADPNVAGVFPQRERERQTDSTCKNMKESQSICNLISKETSTFAASYLEEASHQVQPTLTGRGLHGS